MGTSEPPTFPIDNLSLKNFESWKKNVVNYLSGHQDFQLFLPGGLYPAWNLVPEDLSGNRILNLNLEDPDKPVKTKYEGGDTSDNDKFLETKYEDVDNLTPKQELTNDNENGLDSFVENDEIKKMDQNKTSNIFNGESVNDKPLESVKLDLRNSQLTQMINLICNLSHSSLPENSDYKDFDGLMEFVSNFHKIKETQANILELSDIEYQSNEDYNAFYVKLRSSVCSHLRKKGDKVQCIENNEMLEDEVLSPTFEEVIVLWSLEKIHPGLPKQVKDAFGFKLFGGVTLKDLQKEIFEYIPAFKETLSKSDEVENIDTGNVKREFYNDDGKISLRNAKVKSSYYESEPESDTETNFNKVFKGELDIKQEDFDEDMMEVGGIHESYLQQNMFTDAGNYDDYFDTEKEVKEEKRFSCKDCTLSFKYKKTLLRHTRRTHGADKAKKRDNGSGGDSDNDDDDYDPDDTEFKVKIKKENPQGGGAKPASNKSITCTICNEGFSFKTNLRRHMRRKHGATVKNGQTVTNSLNQEELEKYMDETGTICTFCGKAFIAKSKLIRHISTHLKEKNFPCEVCGKLFSCAEYAKAHMKNHFDEERVDCTECGKSMGKKSLRRHMLTHMEGNSFPCEICGKSFKCAEYLNSHVKSHAEDEKVDCTECGKTIAKISLRRHMMTHSDAKNFPCEVCGKSFKCLEYLNSHLKSHQKPQINKEERVQCLDCGKTVARLSMKRHMMTHNKENKFPCEICGRNFKCMEYLNSHLKCHKTGKDKNVVCSDCGISLTKKSLRRHMLRTHTKKEKSFPCDICGKAFACLEYLNAHISRFHSEDKNVVCPDCGVTVNKSSFKRHALLHKADAVKCEICNKRMGSMDSLERHMKRHSENPNFSTRKPYKRIRHRKPQPPPSTADLWRRSASPPSSAAAADLWKQSREGGSNPAQLVCEGGCGKKFKHANMMRVHMEIEKCGQDMLQDKGEVDSKNDISLFEMRPLAD